MRQFRRTSQSGITFIELIFVSAISVMVFGAIFTSFQYTLELVAVTRAKLSALSLATDRMEYFRSLPYDEVGVVAGFPSGTIPQTSTLSLNEIAFSERVRVDYVDDPADGTLAGDTNVVTQDYKQIRLQYEWDLKGDTQSISMTSYIVPRSIESNVGGGTVRINVLDANASFLEDASVTVFNTANGYSVTSPTNADGTALFSVPADVDYEVLVTAVIGGQQYSTSSTHRISAVNPNPSSAPFSVSEAGISTQTFVIDALSDLTIAAKSAVVAGSMLETFSDLTGVASTTDTTTVAGGDLVLVDTLGVYESTGVVFLHTVTPATVINWETMRVAADLPVDTDFTISLYTGSTSTGYVLVPNSELAGNELGFTDSIIDLSELDPIAYPAITVGVTLSTADTSETPAIDELELFWRESDISLAGESLDIRGDKVIGTDGATQPIYKATSTVVTDGAGVVNINDVEFDTYTVTPAGGYNLATACPAHPFAQQAGIDGLLELHYVAAAANVLRAVVQDSLGRAIPGVTVRLERSGYDVTQETNACGQTFFTGGLVDEVDYELTVSAAGYTTEIIDPMTVSGDTVTEIILVP